MSAPPATLPVRVRSLQIGQTVTHRATGRVYHIGQVWRKDRAVLLTADGYRGQIIGYDTLQRDYRRTG